jgi:hypothetical protein
MLVKKPVAWPQQPRVDYADSGCRLCDPPSLVTGSRASWAPAPSPDGDSAEQQHAVSGGSSMNTRILSLLAGMFAPEVAFEVSLPAN